MTYGPSCLVFQVYYSLPRVPDTEDSVVSPTSPVTLAATRQPVGQGNIVLA